MKLKFYAAAAAPDQVEVEVEVSLRSWVFGMELGTWSLES